jgi:hypothetical protein
LFILAQCAGRGIQASALVLVLFLAFVLTVPAAHADAPLSGYISDQLLASANKGTPDDDDGYDADDSQPEVGEAPPTAADEQDYSNETSIQHYARWIKSVQNKFLSGEIDLWGSTATIPEGFLVVAFGWGTMRPGGRFDENRHLVDLLPVLSVPDPFNNDGEFFSFDFNADGEANGYFVGLSYGINDTLMITASTMMSTLNVKINPIFAPGSVERLGVATLEEFYTMLELLGRPRPKHSYKTDGVDMGDTTLAASWNYYRNEWFSTGMVGSLLIPTSHTAEPNSSIIFGLGPDLDTGVGAWGLGLANNFDFRPPKPLKIITFSFGLESAYYLQSKRESPDFIKPNQDVWDYMTAQGVELDFLPDLSDMDDYYYYTPAPWVAASAGIGAGPISITYRHGWGFEAAFDSNSPGFRKMLDEIGLVGTGDDGKIIVAISIPLTPIYIPGLIQLRTEYQTDGRNAMVFRDIYQAGFGLFFPLNPPERYRLGGAK